MLKSIRGVYRNGKVELLEHVPPETGTAVIVTFLEPGSVSLAEHGVTEQQAESLRHRLAAFSEDWDRPEMDVYDDPESR